MSLNVSFPSEAFPAYPRLSVQTPTDWVALAAVGLPLAVAKTVDEGKFRPNVLVTIARFGAEYSPEAAIKALDAKLKKLPRYKEMSKVREPYLGGEGQHVVGRFAGAKGQMVRQSVSIAVINRGHVYDVLEITGTSALIPGDNIESEIQAIIDSLTVSL